MLRQDSTPIGPQRNSVPDAAAVPSSLEGSRLDIQAALNKLEEMILASPRLPLSRRTLVDEDLLLDQLDFIRLNLPTALQEATQLIQEREAILSEAERYADNMVTAAEQRAAQMLDETGIVQQAEQTAQQLKTQVQQECDALRSQTLAEIDQMRLQAQREWDAMRQQALAEQQTIQQDADTYAEQVLDQIENQLADMLRVIHNGRQQLQSTTPEASAPASNRQRPPSSGRPPSMRPPSASGAERPRR